MELFLLAANVIIAIRPEQKKLQKFSAHFGIEVRELFCGTLKQPRAREGVRENYVVIPLKGGGGQSLNVFEKRPEREGGSS